MKRNCSLWLLTTALLIAASVGAAQDAGKNARVAYFDPGSADGSAVFVEALRQELSKLDWNEGKNLKIEYRFLERKLERASEVAAELLRLKVDLIIVTGTAPALAAKKATRTIPIVMANVGDPVGAGLVASLARPGGNITGFSGLSPELNTKRLDILKETVPKLKRVGLLTFPGANIQTDLQVKELRVAAPALQLQLEEIETSIDANGLERSFKIAAQKQVQAIITTASPRFNVARKRLVELADKNRLPAIYFEKEFVENGGLMSYGVNYRDLYQAAAHYVDKILKGAQPADLPVEQPKKFEFIVNLKAAKQIGLTVPPNVLARADRVIR